MEVYYETEVEVECECPKCRHKFVVKKDVSGTVDVEPPDRDEDG